MVSLSINSSLLNLLGVELSAFLFFLDGRLSRLTHTSSCLTAVSVIIQHLLINFRRTTWSLWEAEWVCLTSKEWLGVWELGAFEEDDLL